MSEPIYVVHESEGRTGDRLAALEQSQAAARTAVVAALNAHVSDSDGHVSEQDRAGWNAAAAGVAGKAEKASNPTAGNFAGLDQYGNPTDSGKKASDFATADDKANLQQAIGAEIVNRTSSYNSLDSRITTLAGDDPSKSMRTVAAEEVAKVVANADTSFDTLKEIADWIQSDTTGAAKMAADIEDLKSEKADAADLATVAISGSYDDLSDKPTIPAAVSVDPTLTQSGAAADAKATGDALAQKRGLGDLAVYAPSAFSEWVFTPLVEGAYLVDGPEFFATESDFNESFYHGVGEWQGAGWYCQYGIEESGAGVAYLGGTQDATELTGGSDFTLTRTVTAWAPASPADALAKTSQLPTVPSAYTSTPAMDGVGSAGSSTAWARGDHVHPSDTSRAAKTELPYPFVSATPSGGTLTVTPRTVATFTADSSAASFTVAVGTGVEDTARDCVLVIDCLTNTGAVAPRVEWSSNFRPRGGDADEIVAVAGVRNVFYISEYAPDQFVVGGWHEEAE